MSTRHLPPPSPTHYDAPPPLLITVTDLPGTALVLHLDGEIDQDQRAALENALEEAVEACPPRLVVDLSGLTFCDSTGLNALLRTRLAAHAADIDLVIAAPPAQVRRLLDITGAGHVLTTCASVRAALHDHGTNRPLPREGMPPCRAG
ncbi:hypothetical protein GCM10010441_10590 [Kitasatospora paracochleata]|uniref:Anti-sigma factor antagonist n=1 Tax=Kitasatospora paracochleata TaxID=58354 RepID=A0ABT1J436_9ACTN|nr:STAS domain-containing protein [Kitasatospora paracochleata]MCP2311516.1 anti-anti-sigma factor [Kitasatospora paracochleata]